MAFGTSRAKKELSVLAAACLVFSAIADQVNTGFLAFSDRVLRYDPPRRSRGRAWRIVEELWALEPASNSTAILPALRFLHGHLKKQNLVFLISDFLSDEDLFGKGELKMLAARHDVVGVVVEDPAEARLPPGRAALELRDLESGEFASIGLDDGLRARYADAMRERRERLAKAFYRVPMDHVFLLSDRPWSSRCWTCSRRGGTHEPARAAARGAGRGAVRLRGRPRGAAGADLAQPHRSLLGRARHVSRSRCPAPPTWTCCRTTCCPSGSRSTAWRS
jgi:hypothetical protein